MRDVERVAVFIEPVRAAVRRQVARERDARHVEKIAHRVLVLRAGEPPHAGADFSFHAGLLGGDERIVQPFLDGVLFVFRRTRLFSSAAFRRTPCGRRPSPSGKTSPAFVKSGFSAVEIETALLRVRIVAIVAVLFEERLVLRIGEPFLRRARERRKQQGEKCATKPAHANSSPRIVPFDVENASASIPSRWSMER